MEHIKVKSNKNQGDVKKRKRGIPANIMSTQMNTRCDDDDDLMVII